MRHLHSAFVPITQNFLGALGALAVLCAGGAQGAALPYCVAVADKPPIKLKGFEDPTWESKLNTSEEPKWKEWRESLYALHRGVSTEMLAPWFKSVSFAGKSAAPASCPLQMDVTLTFENLKGSLLSPFGRKVAYSLRDSSGKVLWEKVVDAGEMKPSIMKGTMAARTKEGLEIAGRKLLSFLSTEAADVLANLVPGGGAEGKAAVASLQRGVQAQLQKVALELPPWFKGVVTPVSLEALSPSAPSAAPALRAEAPRGETPPNPRLHAILVGAVEPADDVERMRALLTGAAGVPEENIHVLVGEKADKKTWKQMLEKSLPEKIKDAEAVFFYFSGRAAYKRDALHFLAHDGDRYAASDVISALERLNAKRVVFLHDSRLEAEGGEARVDALLLGGADPVKLDPARTLYLGSAGIAPKGMSGLFTYALAEGLEGAADRDEDGAVTARELYYYADDLMAATSKAHAAAFADDPRPTLFPEEGGAADFPVGRAR